MCVRFDACERELDLLLRIRVIDDGPLPLRAVSDRRHVTLVALVALLVILALVASGSSFFIFFSN